MISITPTPENNYVFFGSADGSLDSIDRESMTMKPWKVGSKIIYTMAVSKDSKWLFTASYDRTVKKLAIAEGTFGQDFGHTMPERVAIIGLEEGDESLFAYENSCNLKLISAADEMEIKYFKNPHIAGLGWHGRSHHMLVTRDGEYLFTTFADSGFKQWSDKESICKTLAIYQQGLLPSVINFVLNLIIERLFA